MITSGLIGRRAAGLGGVVAIGVGLAGCNLGAPAVEYALTEPGSFITDLTTGDVDNDGHVDVVVPIHGGYVVALNDGNGGFDINRVNDPFPHPGWLATLGDVDGDGNLDLVYVAGSPSGAEPQAEVRLGDGAGGFSTTAQLLPVGDVPRDLDVGDLDGDDDVDVVAVTETPEGDGVGADVWLNDGSGTFASPVAFGTGTNPSDVVLHDVDGDDALDIVTAGADAEAVVGINLGDGAGDFAAAVTYPLPITEELFGTTHVGLADMNDDQVPDVYGGNPTLDQVFVFPGIGEGALGAPILSDATTPDVPNLVAADFDVDGRMDLATGGQAVLFGDGEGSFEADHAVYGGPFVATADFDSNGQPDLAYARSEKLVVMLNQLDGRRDHEDP